MHSNQCHKPTILGWHVQTALIQTPQRSPFDTWDICPRRLWRAQKKHSKANTPRGCKASQWVGPGSGEKKPPRQVFFYLGRDGCLQCSALSIRHKHQHQHHHHHHHHHHLLLLMDGPGSASSLVSSSDANSIHRSLITGNTPKKVGKINI